MTLLVQVKKSDMFIGPLGWNITIEKNIDDPVQGRVKIFLLVHGGPDTGIRDFSPTEESYLKGKLDQFFSLEAGSLERSLNDMVEDIRGIYSKRGSDVNICAILVNDASFRSLSVGNITAFLFRNGNSARIISSGKSLVLANGKVKEGDLIIVSTSELFDLNNPAEIVKRVETYRRLRIPVGTMQMESVKITNYTPFLMLDIEYDVNGRVLPEKTVSQETEGVYREAQQVKENGYLDKIRKVLTLMKPRQFYIENKDYEKDHKKARSAAFIGILLLVVLLLSIAFGIRKKKSDDYRNSYRSDLISAKHNLDESLNIFQLNPGRSRELFIESKKSATELNSKGIKDDALTSLLADINQNQGRILGEYEVSADNFVDLGLITDNFTASKIVLEDGVLYISDNSSRKIIKIDISSKRSEILAGPNKIDEIFDSVALGGRMYVLNSEGIIDVSKSKDISLQNKFTANILSASFGSNIYVLDRSSSQIYKYSADGGHFLPGKSWLTGSDGMDLSKATRMVIDGSVWILTEGKINRFVQGKASVFRPDTSTVGDMQIDDIFTSENTSGIYIMDRTAGKIVVFDKDGKYVARYSSDSIKGSSAIAVSESDKKIFLLLGSKVIKLDIKHLQ